MPTYRKKPVVIEAVQLRWSQWNEVVAFLGAAFPAENPAGAHTILEHEASDTCGEAGPNYIALVVRTAHGELAVVRHGDWIIPEKQPGRFYPCKPDVFAATYTPVEERDLIDRIIATAVDTALGEVARQQGCIASPTEQEARNAGIAAPSILVRMLRGEL